MLETMIRNWWVPLLRGIMAIIFGVVALLFPGEAATALIWVFGIYVLIDGAVTLYNAIAKPVENRMWEIIEGIVEIIAGIGAFLWTPLTGLAIVILIGIWAIVTGILQIASAWKLREEIENEIWLGLAGLLSVIMGVLFLYNPISGFLATIFLIGIYSIIFGIMFIMLGFRLRNMDPTELNKRTPTAA